MISKKSYNHNKSIEVIMCKVGSNYCKSPYTFSNSLHNIFILLLLFLSIILFISQLYLTSMAKSYDPALKWKVLESEVCSVIFPSKLSDKNLPQYQYIALRIAEIAESIYPHIKAQLKNSFSSGKKFTIILEDFNDYTYGFASPLPHPIIRINLSATTPKIFDTKFDCWLKILIAHEYTHLAHFDMTYKLTSFLRFFLGQVITPNALQPLWSIEGLAIYNESKLNTGGRLEDSRYEMYLRTDFLEKQVLNLDQLEGNYLISWPAGNAPYIYGQSLVHFIAQEYGEDKLIAISEKFSLFPLLGINWSLKKVLGINQTELFCQWQKKQEEYFKNQLKKINNYSEITKSQQITNHKYWVSDPLWLLDKVEHKYSLIYKVITPQSYPTIRQYDPLTSKESILIKRTSGLEISYSLSPDQNYLLYSKLINYQQYYTFHDLFLYNLNTGKQYQITEKLRIKDPAWHPDHSSSKIAAVINEAGTNNLVLFTLNIEQFEKKVLPEKIILFSDLIYLTDFHDGTQIAQPVWSPQGDKIAISLWNNGYQDIYIITIDDHNQIQSIRPITLDYHTDINPNWSYDGQYLYFASDRSKVFNLYAYSIKNNQLFRLTNVSTGAFEPASSPDGSEIAFIQYHSSGYELHLAKTDELLWKVVKEYNLDVSRNVPAISNNKIYFPQTDENELDGKDNNKLKKEEGLENISSKLLIKNYSPWDSIIPTYWIPYLDITEQNFYLGFSTLGEDYLKHFHIPIKLAYNLFDKTLFYDFQFFNFRTNPVFSLSFQGEISNYSKLQMSLRFTDTGYTSKQDSGRSYSQNITIGLKTISSITGNDIRQNNLAQDILSGNYLILKYDYNDTEKYPASISSETGNSFSLNYQYGIPFTDKEYSFHKILFDGRKYLSLALPNNVLALRLVAGAIVSKNNNLENIKFTLGGTPSLLKFSFDDTDSFSLRGYPFSSHTGNNLLLNCWEYRFPLKLIERKIGFEWASIYLSQISGKLFFDAGCTWDEPTFPSLEDLSISIGTEIDFLFRQRYSKPITLSLGMGKAITQQLPATFYIRFGLPF